MLADTHKLKELISIRPTLQEMLQEVLQAEGKRWQMEVRIYTKELKVSLNDNYISKYLFFVII